MHGQQKIKFSYIYLQFSTKNALNYHKILRNISKILHSYMFQTLLVHYQTVH
jgi:hypothetical protein